MEQFHGFMIRCYTNEKEKSNEGEGMRIKVKLKAGCTIPQPTTRHAWSYGYIVGFVTMGDGVGYAVVETCSGEFECVSLHALLTAPLRER